MRTHWLTCLITAVVLVLCAGCVGSTPEQPVPPEGPPDGPAPDPRAEALLTEHNAVRASATPTPSPPLPPLTWSAAAAEKAQSWASRCDFQHNPDRDGMGENLFATTELDPSVPDIVASWSVEAADYDYASNTCSKTCGHYTQLVWRSTTQLGCGTARCSTGSPLGGGDWTFVVCNYAPTGNFVGQRPY